MQIGQRNIAAELPRLEQPLLAFDVEMANSFRHAPPVICMIGLERYDPRQRRCLSTVASITRRTEEEELMRWFLEQVRTFHVRAPQGKLLSFSGKDNDLPWIRTRMECFGLPAEILDPPHGIGHVDLKEEFRNRTQSDNISLKRLEQLFRIPRADVLASRRVSWLLTRTLGQRNSSIPAEICSYLRQDVHSLLRISNDWWRFSLDAERVNEREYLQRTLRLEASALRLLERTGESAPAYQALLAFQTQLHKRWEEALRIGSMEDFELPAQPLLSGQSSLWRSFQRRYASLCGIQRLAPSGLYRLQRSLHKPKGTLVVVQYEGKLLMIRRAEHLRRAPGYWGLPGGVMEAGESPTDCAVRELREETGLFAEAERVIGCTSSVSGWFELFWVSVRIEAPSPLQLAPDEVADARWVNPAELAQLHPLIPGSLPGFRTVLGGAWGRGVAPVGRSRKAAVAQDNSGNA